ncbi:MAG: HlyD family efflux transporter periplasmic adaptor subunit [Sedimentisphaerales bacterium]|nr:HlyD family efflux transporter periplasmic adaptor subunit [Sedimentisphaerales bacterium]
MTVSEIIEQFTTLGGKPGLLLQNLLAAQCFLGQAQAGAILRLDAGHKVDVLALYPQFKSDTPAPRWLTLSMKYAHESTRSSDAVFIKPFGNTDSSDSDSAKSHIVLIPIMVPNIDKTIAAFLLTENDEETLEQNIQKLQLASGILSYSQSSTVQQNWQQNCLRLREAMETLSAINKQKKFTGAAMAFCNEAAAQWQCERASIGFLKGRYVQLKAMSRTEDFSRKMKVVQDIESTMEECLDQDTEILVPAPKESAYINRAANALSKFYGTQAVLSLPLRHEGKVVAILTLERPLDRIFSISEVETIRLACELCTPRLMHLYEHGRWIGAKIASGSRKFASVFVGSKYTWTKLITLLVCAAIVFLIYAEGQFRVKASFVLEATNQQVIPAPFDGYIEKVNVEVGDSVEAGETILASLDTTDLRLKLAQAESNKSSYKKQASASRDKASRDQDELAQAVIFEEKEKEVDAEIEYLKYQIDQASIISPMSGVVVKGDLKRQIGAPVKVGDVMFEVCPLEALRAQLHIPEDQIFDIEDGQEGELALASDPGRKIQFVVEKINPIAEVENQQNIFKVRVQLREIHPGMRPGMEGVAKVTIGERRYAWIWSRKIVNWVRMKLWL